MGLPTISSLWIGQSLTLIEKLCISSFLHHGHDFILYVYGPVDGVPQGTTIADANQFLRLNRRCDALSHEDIEILCDCFKYRMLKGTDAIWVDLDMLCLKPWRVETTHVLGWQKQDQLVAGAVLRLDPMSEVLEALVNATEEPFGIPEWLGKNKKEELEAVKGIGRKLSPKDFPRGTFGVHALSHFLKKNARYQIQKMDRFFSCEFKNRNDLFDDNDPITPKLHSANFGLHL